MLGHYWLQSFTLIYSKNNLCTSSITLSTVHLEHLALLKGTVATSSILQTATAHIVVINKTKKCIEECMTILCLFTRILCDVKLQQVVNTRMFSSQT